MFEAMSVMMSTFVSRWAMTDPRCWETSGCSSVLRSLTLV